MQERNDDEHGFFLKTMDEDVKAARLAHARRVASTDEKLRQAGFSLEEQGGPEDEGDFELDDVPVLPKYDNAGTARANLMFPGSNTEKYPMAPRKMPGVLARAGEAVSTALTRDIPSAAVTTADLIAGVGSKMSASMIGPSFRGFGLHGVSAETAEQYKAAEAALGAVVNNNIQQRHQAMQFADSVYAGEIGAVNDAFDYQVVRGAMPTLMAGVIGGTVGGGAAAMSLLSSVLEGTQSGAGIASELLARGDTPESAALKGGAVALGVGLTSKFSYDTMFLRNTPLKALARATFGEAPAKWAGTVGTGMLTGALVEGPLVEGVIQTGLIEEPARVLFGLSDAGLGDIAKSAGQAAAVGGFLGGAFGGVAAGGRFDAYYANLQMSNIETVRAHATGDKKAVAKAKEHKKAAVEIRMEMTGETAKEAAKFVNAHRDFTMRASLQGITDVMNEAGPVSAPDPLHAFMRAENAKDRRINSVQQMATLLASGQLKTPDEIQAVIDSVERGEQDEDISAIVDEMKVAVKEDAKKKKAPAAPKPEDPTLAEKAKAAWAAETTATLKAIKEITKEIDKADSALKVAVTEAESKPKKRATGPSEDEIQKWLDENVTQDTKGGETLEAHAERQAAARKQAIAALKKAPKDETDPTDALNAKLDELMAKREALHGKLTRLAKGEAEVDADTGKPIVSEEPLTTKGVKLRQIEERLNRALANKSGKAKSVLAASLKELTTYVQAANIPADAQLAIERAASAAILEAGKMTPETAQNLRAAVATAKSIQLKNLYAENVAKQFQRLQQNIDPTEKKLFEHQRVVAKVLETQYDAAMQLPEDQRAEAMQKVVDQYRAYEAITRNVGYKGKTKAEAEAQTLPYDINASAWVQYMAAVRYYTEDPIHRGMPLTVEELSTASNMVQQLNVVGKKNLQRLRAARDTQFQEEIRKPVLGALMSFVRNTSRKLTKEGTDNLTTLAGATKNVARISNSLSYFTKGKRWFRFSLEGLKDVLVDMPDTKAFFDKYLNAHAAERAREYWEKVLIQDMAAPFGGNSREDIPKIMDVDSEYDEVTIRTAIVLDGGVVYAPTFTRAQLRELDSLMREAFVAEQIKEVMGIDSAMLEDAWKNLTGGKTERDEKIIAGKFAAYAKMFDLLNTAWIRQTGVGLDHVKFYTRLFRRTFTTLGEDPNDPVRNAEDRAAFMPAELAAEVNRIVAEDSDMTDVMRQMVLGTSRSVSPQVSIAETKSRAKSVAHFVIKPDYQVGFDYALDIAKFMAYTPMVANMVNVYDQFDNAALAQLIEESQKESGALVTENIAASKALLRDLIDVMSNGDSVDPLVKSKTGSSFIGMTATVMVSGLNQFFVQWSSILPALLATDPKYAEKLPDAAAALVSTKDTLMTAIRATEMVENRFLGKMSRETEMTRQISMKLQTESMSPTERHRYIKKHSPQVLRWMTMGVRHGDLFASSLVAYAVAKTELERGKTEAEAIDIGLRVVSETQQTSDVHLNIGVARKGGVWMSALFLFTQTGFIMANALASAGRDLKAGKLTWLGYARVFLSMVVLQGAIEVLLRGLDKDDEKLPPHLLWARLGAAGFANTPFLGPALNGAGDWITASLLNSMAEERDDQDLKKLAQTFDRKKVMSAARTNLSLQNLAGFYYQNATSAILDVSEARKVQKEIDGLIRNGMTVDEELMQSVYRYYTDAAFRIARLLPIMSGTAPVISDARFTVAANYGLLGVAALNEAIGGDPDVTPWERAVYTMMGATGASPKKREAKREFDAERDEND